MIIKDEDAIKRLTSPFNLINQLKSLNNGNNKRKDAMSLFCGNGEKKDDKKVEMKDAQISESHPPQNTQLIPTLPQEQQAVLDQLIEDHDTQVKLGLTHNSALDLLANSVNRLNANLESVRSDKLPSVISAASKVVESIRKERNEAAKGGSNRDVHFHFYTPEQKSVSEYEIIDVN